MTPKRGWLDDQFEEVSANVKSWPEWMVREARLDDIREERYPARNAGSQSEPDADHRENPSNERNLE